MRRTVLHSKIHRATVIEANLNYIGSITIDKALMKAADILPYELVHVVNVTNGNRLETYAIEGEANSGMIAINGAAAHLINPKDIVIIMSFVTCELMQALKWQPKVIFVDECNKIIEETNNLQLIANERNRF